MNGFSLIFGILLALVEEMAVEGEELAEGSDRWSDVSLALLTLLSVELDGACKEKWRDKEGMAESLVLLRGVVATAAVLAKFELDEICWVEELFMNALESRFTSLVW